VDHYRKHCAPLEREASGHCIVYKHLAPLERSELPGWKLNSPMSTLIRAMRLQDHKRRQNGRILLVAVIALAVVGLLTWWLLLRSQSVHDAAVNSTAKIRPVVPNAQPNFEASLDDCVKDPRKQSEQKS
jgi:hypothetical protein